LIVWRLCRRPYADLSGEGAARYGGRWNSPGNRVVYTTSSAALAVLEVRVHLDLPFDLLPEDYVLVAIDLGALEVETVQTDVSDPRAFGDAWIKQARTPVLQVPSVIVPETNFLLNPSHQAASLAKIADIRPFGFDPRLWRGSA
jgi:RES domain-containing protein